MKTRENELHEPFIDMIYDSNGYSSVQVSCNVCGTMLYDSDWYRVDTEQTLMQIAKVEVPNYCLNCGARLKEI